ncbi:hypothetical protein BU23DRAFT_575249 [Bimuria novae-zelandiae CBS 107.79]|uniref:Uncharacterized protein n=1 Tax=Bimuria novae-zelandiae CBS 107.79 TaxID=1447943 RepID=A0A6A5UVJ0_9PLEO|nr:hypothetical protein BU23DRAFT_575249 [Bimuria novae-zelandiae CBS 107.79]
MSKQDTGIGRKPIAEYPRYLRYDTRLSEEIHVKPMDSRHPRIVHQNSSATSVKADDEYTPDGTGTDPISSGYRLSTPYDNTGVKSFHVNTNVKQASQRYSSPDTQVGLGIRGLGIRGLGGLLPPTAQLSPLDVPSFKGASTSSSGPPSLALSEGPLSPLYQSPPLFHYDEPENRPRPQNYGLPSNPAPGRQGQKIERYPVDPIPQHKGWDDFRSPRGFVDVQTDAGVVSTHAPWSTKDRQPVLQSKFRQELGKEKDQQKQKQKRPPATARPKGKKSRKEEGHQITEKATKIAARIKDLYVDYRDPDQKLKNALMQAMKEEGCEAKDEQTSREDPRLRTKPSIQETGEGTRELKHGDAPPEIPNPRTKALNEAQQLKIIHRVAAKLPRPKPRIPPAPISEPAPEVTSPLQSHLVTEVPSRPKYSAEPLGAGRSPTLLQPLPDALLPHYHGIASAVSPVSPTSIIAPLRASPSVQAPATATEEPQPMAIPKKDLPHSEKPQVRGIQKKGLPPRPVPAPGEREPIELRFQEELYMRVVGMSPPQPFMESSDATSRPAVGMSGSMPGTIYSRPVESQCSVPEAPTLAVGSHSAFHSRFTSTLKSSTHLNPSVKPGSGHNENKPHRFAHAVDAFFDGEILTDLLAPNKDKTRKKHTEKLKQTISKPKLHTFPAGVAAPPIPKNSARRASRSLVRDIGEPCASSTVQEIPLAHAETEAKGTEKEGKGKEKEKEKKANWAGVSVQFAFHSRRRDSDSSWVCADAKKETDEFRKQQAQGEARKRSQQPQPQPQVQPKVEELVDSKCNSHLDHTFLIFRGPIRAETQPEPYLPSHSHQPQPPRSQPHPHPQPHPRPRRPPPIHPAHPGLRQPGPSTLEKHFSNADLVPAPLGVRKSEADREKVRDTGFYAGVGSVLREYEGVGVGVDMEEERSGWI